MTVLILLNSFVMSHLFNYIESKYDLKDNQLQWMESRIDGFDDKVNILYNFENGTISSINTKEPEKLKLIKEGTIISIN